MKHITYFQDFLSKEVNLNETRLKKLNGSSSAVNTFLSGNLDLYEKTERQGSYGLKTIIKPVGTREYDADLLLYMTYDEDKEPKDYINDVYNCLKGNDNYKDKVHRKTRCIYIDYTGDFHLDLVPCITQQDWFTQEEKYLICNNKDNKFEVTDGTGYRVKCYRLFRPKFSKVKTSFVAQIRQVSNTLTPSAGVCDYTPV